MIWLLVIAMAAIVITCVAAGIVAWLEAQQIQELQAEVKTLNNERHQTQALIAAMQSTAAVMEERLGTLEANDPAQQLAALQAAVETANDTEELGALNESLSEIQARVDEFQNTLDNLNARMEALEPDQEVANLPSEIRLQVGLQRQNHNLSCESSAASMAAQYQGLDLSEADFLAALPYNDNPNLGFRGNIDGPTGGIQDYGVYADPLLDVMTSFGLKAWPVQGGVPGIQAAVARGNPVIVWVTYDCMPSTPVETEISGENVVLVPNQHVVVVTGYNAEGIWANDPWDGQEEFYTYADLERAMGYFGDMAIEIGAY
jgi:uncharacterized protein YvpB